MTTLLVLVWTGVAVLLLLVLGMRPERTRHTLSELKRREDHAALRREKLLGDVLAIRQVVIGLLLVKLTLFGLLAWGTPGLAPTVGIWLIAGALSRLKPLHSLSMKLYKKIEPFLLNTVEKTGIIGWLFRTEKHVTHSPKLESVEHLIELIESSGHVLSADQQTIIKHGISWHTTSIDSVMTPAKDIFSIKHTELLGPLVLDDLHRSGHTRFPVIRGNINNIVGILDISQLLEVDAAKRSETAEKNMTSQVLRIESDEDLPTALALLQKSHQHMLIVVDEEGNTKGLATLADITTSLVGKNRGGVV